MFTGMGNLQGASVLNLKHLIQFKPELQKESY
jgi:hypothetical protein